LWRFLGGAGIGVFDARGERAGVKKGVGQALGVRAVGFDGDGNPGHESAFCVVLSS
jgi:hypothetical protein